MALIRLRTAATWMMSGMMLEHLVGFASQIVIARHLGPEQFGQFVLVLATAGLVFAVFSLRVNILIIRTPSRVFTRRLRQLYFTLFTIETFIGLALTLAWLLLTSEPGPYEIGLVLALGAAHWINTDLMYWERRMPYRRLAVITSGTQIAAHGVALAVVLAGGGIAALFLREMAVVVLRFAILWAIGAVRTERLVRPTADELRGVLKETRGVWLDGMLENGFQRITILLAGMVGGERGAGLFFFAQRLAIVPHSILSPFTSRIVSNWFSRTADVRTRLNGRRQAMHWVFWPLLAAAGLTILLADPVVPFVFGDKWVEAAPVLAAMAGVVVFSSMLEIVKVYCISRRFTRALLLGRIAQYAGFLLPLPLAMGGLVAPSLALGLALSMAMGLAFVVAGAALLSLERRSLAGHGVKGDV